MKRINTSNIAITFMTNLQTILSNQKSTKKIILLVAISSVFFFVTACTGVVRDTSLAKASSIGFTEQLFETSNFTLFGLIRPGRGDRLRVYIEGDGKAWLSRTRPSSDPTPDTPVALNLAMADPSSDHILYLARPCQYVTGEARRNCAPPAGIKYWTDARLGQEVIESLNQAINIAKDSCRASKIALTGYSGGGGASVLLAARRNDVNFLGTVAGNLDSGTWTRLLGVSPLARSLEPMDAAVNLRSLPQRHLSSSADKTMPPAVSAGFCKTTGRPETCVTVHGLPHSGSWQNVWNYEY